MSETNGFVEPEAEAVEPKSFFTRLGNVYMSPGESFEEIRPAPRLALPIIIFIIVSMVAGFYMAGMIDMTSLPARQMQQGNAPGGGPTPEQMQNILKYGVKISLILGLPFQNFLMVLVIAGFIKLLCVISTKENSFKDLFAVSIYASVAVLIIYTLAIVLTYYLKGPGTVSMTNMGSPVASSLGAILASLFGNNVLPKFVMGLAQRV